MKSISFLFLALSCCFCNGQYEFKGSFPKKYVGHTAFLSLVDDYRKVTRVYSNQIIQKAVVDSSGTFFLKGSRLSPKNRIYRIHIDDCTDAALGKNHFLSTCTSTKQVVFLANNNTSISFPILANDQPLCKINSSNPSSGVLLEIDQLKEAMILDLMESYSTADEQLKFSLWFNQLQQYAMKTDDPLAELYVYDFLSDKKNETHAYYLNDLKNNPYYKKLGKRLENSYHNAPFVLQYIQELNADMALNKSISETSGTGLTIKAVMILLLLGVPALLVLQYSNNRRRKTARTTNVLTPQEQRVYSAIQANKTNKEIASELFVSMSTVKTHINSIYKKLEISSRQDISKNPPRV